MNPLFANIFATTLRMEPVGTISRPSPLSSLSWDEEACESRNLPVGQVRSGASPESDATFCVVYAGPTHGRIHQILGRSGAQVLVKAEGAHAFYAHELSCDFLGSRRRASAHSGLPEHPSPGTA